MKKPRWVQSYIERMKTYLWLFKNGKKRSKKGSTIVFTRLGGKPTKSPNTHYAKEG